jgi:hypothetical protein
MMQAVVERSEAYPDQDLAQLSKLIAILEGNGKPLGITKNQDVSLPRLRPELREELLAAGAKKLPYGRLSMNGVPLTMAMQAILEDKQASLRANFKPATMEAIAERWNSEKHLKKETGKSYSEWISSIYKDITEQFGNEEARRLLKAKEAPAITEGLFPTLELLQRGGK